MSSSHAAMEALSRIEHKIDLLLESLAQTDGNLVLRSVSDPNHVCPLCQWPVGYQVDLLNQSLTRRCGCSTGVQPAINLQPFAPPTPTENGNGQDE